MINEARNKKIINTLKKRVSYLRFAVYVFVAISFLLTALIAYWVSSPTDEAFETFFSEATRPPQALLYLSPIEGNYSAEEEFSIDVLINTAGSYVNVAAAYLSYDKNKIKAISIDVSNSLFNMLAEQVINEKEGKIKITLGIPTPGIKIHNGKVATIRFKALDKTRPLIENIYFDFTKGSDLYSGVYLNDKKGTNILNATRGAKIFIN
ncbi:hypothetical protein KJ853_03390 [Patescibacteria group bacterium]|nr:hypothetical protein [Patescibacteria group bacterium]